MIMCDVMEEYMEQARQEEREKAQKEKQQLLDLITRMSQNGDSDKIEQLQNPEFLREMLNKYGL